mmetsp:Transcript_17916/g.21948  ORF Transcript_17916/g.21948 Transcript_17916/m.21948 type:complete len:87 (+) Transcript_17916:82-342(+)
MLSLNRTFLGQNIVLLSISSYLIIMTKSTIICIVEFTVSIKRGSIKDSYEHDMPKMTFSQLVVDIFWVQLEPAAASRHCLQYVRAL